MQLPIPRPLCALLLFSITTSLSVACAAGIEPDNAPAESPVERSAVSTNAITVTYATYGANLFGATAGNVTRQVANRCNGRDRCDFVVNTAELFPPAPYCAPFRDVPGCDPAGSCGNIFCAYLSKLGTSGVMPAPTGCAPGSLCPTDAVSRLEMASYIIRAKLGIGPVESRSVQHFRDVAPSSPYYHFVQLLHERGVVRGCQDPPNGLFCANQPVTRGEMATMIIRALYDERYDGAEQFAAPPEQLFEDVPRGHPFYRYIEQLAALGITNGCGTSHFCPDRSITKGEASVFVSRAFFPNDVPRAVPMAARAKDFVVAYRCADGVDRVASIPVEANGRTVSLSCGPPPACVEDPATVAFRHCLGPNGVGAICQIAAGIHDVCSTLTINRAEIRHVIGTEALGAAATVLRRGATGPENAYIMRAGSTVTDLTISYLTFDGNRYGVDRLGRSLGLNCLPVNTRQPYWDLSFDEVQGKVTAEWLNFINAPHTAVLVGGRNSVLRFSNIGQGFGSARPQRTATRFTAVWLTGVNTSVAYNAISYAGTAGITVVGQNNEVIGNRLLLNRYEISDGRAGGQLTFYKTARNAYIAGNVIDGQNWIPYPNEILETGCMAPPQREEISGVEMNGIGHGLYNNAILGNPSQGIGFAGIVDGGGRVAFSTRNPRYERDESVARYIEGNGIGIDFLGLRTLASHEEEDSDECRGGCVIAGVKFEDLLLRNSTRFGIRLESVVDAPDYTGFTTSACMSGNGVDVQNENVGLERLSSATPPSTTSWRGSPCPIGSLVPMRSTDTRWAW